MKNKKKTITIFFLLLFLISCVQKESSEHINTILERKRCSTAYSEDVVLLSDPFFAVSFIEGVSEEYSRFYTLSQRYGKSSTLYVTVDNPNKVLFVNNVRVNISLWENNKELSMRKFLHATQARMLILSPLFLYYSPLQANNIYKQRGQCGRLMPHILENTGLQRDENFMTIDYSYATVALAKDIAKQSRKMTKITDDSVALPQLYIFTDVVDINVRRTLQVFLRYFYLLAPNITVNMSHYNRTPSSDLFTQEQIKKINLKNDIMLLYVGPHTQRTLKELYQGKYKEYVQNIFYIGGWNNNMNLLRKSIPEDRQAHAWINAPLSAIFQDALFVSAKIYRLTTISSTE